MHLPQDSLILVYFGKESHSFGAGCVAQTRAPAQCVQALTQPHTAGEITRNV